MQFVYQSINLEVYLGRMESFINREFLPKLILKQNIISNLQLSDCQGGMNLYGIYLVRVRIASWVNSLWQL